MSDQTPKQVKQWLPKHYFYFSGLERRQADGDWAVSLTEFLAKLQEVNDSFSETVYVEVDMNDDEISFHYYRDETPREIEERTRSASQRKEDRIKQLEKELKELKEGL